MLASATQWCNGRDLDFPVREHACLPKRATYSYPLFPSTAPPVCCAAPTPLLAESDMRNPKGETPATPATMRNSAKGLNIADFPTSTSGLAVNSMNSRQTFGWLTRWARLGDHRRLLGLAQAGPVAATAGGKAPSTNGTEAVPTLALRGGICGEFVDFGLLPALVSALNPERGGPAVSRWAGLLDEWGFDSRHIDPDDGRSAAAIAAEGAWRLVNRIGLVRDGQATEAGQAVAALAGVGAEDRQEALAPSLKPGVEAALAGQGGKPILPLLERAAQSLAESTNLWVRVCPALMPIEVGAIVQWACIDFRHAESLVKDIEINRDVAMHRGGPPYAEVSIEVNRERHFERVMEFYMDQPALGGRVPFSLGEELALAKLIGFCGALREADAGPGGACLLGSCRYRSPRGGIPARGG